MSDLLCGVVQRGSAGQVTGVRRAGSLRLVVRSARVGVGGGVGEGFGADVRRGVALRGRPQALLHRLPGRREQVTQDLSTEEGRRRTYLCLKMACLKMETGP